METLGGWKRCAAAFAVLTLTLTACGGRTFYDVLGDMVADTAGGTDWSVDRADLDYADMDLKDATLAGFKPYTAAFDKLTERGADGEDFTSAETDLRRELYRLYTRYTLLSNAAYADATNEDLADKAGAALVDYYEAYDEFMLAHRRLAESANRDLLELGYSGAYIDYFESYVPSNGGEDALTDEENELISRYYALAGDIATNADEIGEIFVRLVELRRAMAEYAGYDSYADLAYEGLYARSYTPADAESVWQGAREWFAPLVRRATALVMPAAAELQEDTSFDCSSESVLRALGAAAGSVSPELDTVYEYLTKYHLYDIDVSPKKAKIGYTVFLHYYNEPFIFNAASGNFYDYSDLAHEFGHFASYYYCPSELIFGLADNDLSELQAQGMGAVISTRYPELFGAVGDTMRDCVLLELAVSVVDGAMYDEFQQRVFEEEGLTPERVSQIFSEVYLSYGYDPYEGFETEWMEVAHNFETPFYYISYAVSALGALEIDRRCGEDFDSGLKDFMTILSMDPEMYYFTEAMEEAGLPDVFDTSAYENIAGALARSLGIGSAAA